MSRWLYLIFQSFRVSILTTFQVFSLNIVLTSMCAYKHLGKILYPRNLGVRHSYFFEAASRVWNLLPFLLSVIVPFFLYVQGFKYSSKKRDIS